MLLELVSGLVLQLSCVCCPRPVLWALVSKANGAVCIVDITAGTAAAWVELDTR